MSTWRLGALVLARVLAATSAAWAQYPYPNYNPYQAQQQYMLNVAGQRNLFNPGFGPAANPYAPGAAVFAPAANPYAPASPYDPYSSLYQPYADPYGGYLRGAADYMRAYGQTVNAIEQARILREQALQARYDTKRKAFDTEMYIKANTPTFTEEQAKIAKMTLKRIQSNANSTEISSGKALNLLLDDLRRYPGKKAAMENLALSEDTLRQINIIKSGGNFGLLRDQGKFAWPLALQDKDLVSLEKQKEIEGLTETLFKAAVKGKTDLNALKDLRTSLDAIRDTLSRKVNEIPTTQYLEAKRFLNDFDDARFALEKGEVGAQMKYREFVSGGKTVQEVADYLVSNGYKIAPAVSGDEAAYRAVHSAMAALDVAVNTQYAVPDYKENPLSPP